MEDGASCRQALGSGDTVDFGIIGEQDDAAAYIRYSMALGVPERRIDCTRMYDLQIESLKQEIEMLKMKQFILETE